MTVRDDSQLSPTHYDYFVIQKRMPSKSILQFIRQYKADTENRFLFLQTLNTSSVFSQLHLKSACHLALRRFIERGMKTKDLGLETILCLTGQTQINAALEYAGLPEVTEAFILLIYADKEDVITSSYEAFCKHFGITDSDSIAFEECPSLLSSSEACKRFNISLAESQELDRVSIERYILGSMAILDAI